jgi:hypothetical protein
VTDVNAPLDELHALSASASAEIRRRYHDARHRLGLDQPADYTLPRQEPTT